MIKRNKLILPLFLACLNNTVFAGGPLATSATDAPIVYPANGSTITIKHDLGTLGSRSNSQAAVLLNESRAIWNSISTSSVNISRGDDLSTNITDSNFENLFNNSSNDNSIVFDSDGDITEEIFGEHQSNYVTSFNISSNDGTHITKAIIFINGNNTNNKTDDEVIIAMTHALGHMIGLDHTQLDETQGLTLTSVPVMYPLSLRDTPTLHEDDIIAASTLYPSTITNFGTLSGSFSQQNGSPIRGANIWVKEINTNKVYSTITDYFNNNNGNFSLNLPAGTYTVHAESIQTNFYGSNRVGPYSQNQTDISFQSPHPLTAIAYGQAEQSEIDDDSYEHDHHDGGGGSSSTPVNNTPPVNIVITAGNARNIVFNLSGVIPVSDNDIDSDGINDVTDTCPSVFNPDQADLDLDGFGNACDSDDDNDTLSDTFEMANGLDPLDATGINGADGDADSDGFTNLEEQTLGTDASLESGATSNPGFINFSTATLSVNEDAGVASMGITRTGGSVGAVSVYCFSTDIASEAVAGSDYDAITSYIDWADGDAAGKTCNITINDDTETETDETLQLDLSSPTGGVKLGEP